MAGKEVARSEAPTTALAISTEQTTWTDRQLATLRQIGVENASDGDLEVFFHQVKRTGLDPFAKQIYMISRTQWNSRTRQEEAKQTIQTGIDGFRLIARRAADSAGDVLSFEDTLWCGPDGKWVDVWVSPQPPAAAKVVVVRGHGQRYPAVATLAEYAGWTGKGNERRLTRMWQEKAALMLAKCAEALALRRAFPQDLSGLYTADEMGASQDARPDVVAVQPEQRHEDVTDAEVVTEQHPQENTPAQSAALTTEQAAAVDTLLNRVLAERDVQVLRATYQQAPEAAKHATVHLDREYARVLGIGQDGPLGAVMVAAGQFVAAHERSVDDAVLDPANDTPAAA